MRGLRILLVEDDAEVAEGLHAGLVSLGHTVVGSGSDGRQAVELAALLQPGLIVMDIQLPVMDGIEASRQILALHGIPIVLVTGFLDDDLIQRSTDAGVMAYLLKPVDLRLLQVAIELACARFEEMQILRGENRELKDALEARKVVERAKGILMQRLGLSEAKAFQLMRERSRSRRISLKDLASAILEAEQVLAPHHGERDAGAPPGKTSDR
jgi:response regulator NasT